MDENRAVMIEHRALSTDTVDVQCVFDVFSSSSELLV